MVFIVPPSGETFALNVNPNATTLHQLKVAIEEFNGVPVWNQRLFPIEKDSDLICNLGVEPFSTLTLLTPFYGNASGRSTDDTIRPTSCAVKEAKTMEELDRKEKEEEEELDRKAKEECDRKLLGEKDESDDEVVKRCDAIFKRAVKRGYAEMKEMRMAEMKQDLQLSISKVKDSLRELVKKAEEEEVRKRAACLMEQRNCMFR